MYFVGNPLAVTVYMKNPRSICRMRMGRVLCTRRRALGQLVFSKPSSY